MAPLIGGALIGFGMKSPHCRDAKPRQACAGIETVIEPSTFEDAERRSTTVSLRRGEELHLARRQAKQDAAQQPPALAAKPLSRA
jgi:hypothetical protein